MRATREIRAGCVWVNDHIPIISEMPHGGYKASGYGKDMSQYSLRGVHQRQARHVRRHGSGPQGLAPHRLHRHHQLTVPSSPDPTERQPEETSHRERHPSRPEVPSAGAGPASPGAPCCGRRRRRPRRGPRRLRHRQHRDDAPSRRPTVKDKSATDKVVRWANWPLYLDYDDKTKKYPTLETFQKQTGIKATYTEDIDDNDTYYGKIQAQLKNGHDIGKDVIVLTDWMAGRLIRQGYVQKLDHANIPNAKNLNPKLQNVDFDPGRNYSLTWQSGFAGIGYHKEKVGRELKTVDDLWAPDLKGKVEVLTEMRDTMGLIMLARASTSPSRLHRRPVQQRRSTCCRSRSTPARSARSRATPTWTTSSSGDALAVIGWSGDIFQLNAENGDPTGASRSPRPAARSGATT